MKFFLDENIPKQAVEMLHQSGHETYDVRSTSDEGASDETIFELAQAEKAVFLTTDKDFFHTIPIRYKRHHGIIIIALKQPNRTKIIEKLQFCLDHIDLNDFYSKILLMRDNHYMIY